MLISKKADKNYIEDTETTPKSCLNVVFELMATTAGTSTSNSLLESVCLLESQLQVERQSFIAFYDMEPPPSPNLSWEG